MTNERQTVVIRDRCELLQELWQTVVLRSDEILPLEDAVEFLQSLKRMCLCTQSQLLEMREDYLMRVQNDMLAKFDLDEEVGLSDIDSLLAVYDEDGFWL